MEGDKDTKPAAAPEVETTDDPRKFMRAFFKSEKYQSAYRARWEKLKPSHATEKQKRLVFLGSDEAKFALIDFGSEQMHLRWNPDHYPEESRTALEVYIDTVRDMERMFLESHEKEDITTLDALREQYHETAAGQLVKDRVVPTNKIGRAFARLILISLSLDTAKAAREPDIERIRRKFGAISRLRA